MLTPTPVECARALAEDRHLAVEFAQLSAVGDRLDAIDVATEAAADIVDHCLRVQTPEDRHNSFAMVIDTIARVATEREGVGDELQAVWCRTLSACLLDGGGTGTRFGRFSAP
jgi:hypothetical protein